MSAPTIWQANAAAFSSTPEAYIDAERHDATRKAVAALREGRPGYALFVMARSLLERQTRIAGLGTHEVGPVCPCGRQCPTRVGGDWSWLRHLS